MKPRATFDDRGPRRVLRTAVGCILVFIAWLVTAPRAADRSGVVDTSFAIDSRAVLGWASIVKGQVAGAPVLRIPVRLLLPSTSGTPVPLVVLVHSSGGLGDLEFRYANTLVGEGIGAALPDSFTPRGVTTTGGQQERVLPTTMVGDAYAVLNRLGRDARIDSHRIAIVGFSKGGTVASSPRTNRYAACWRTAIDDSPRTLPFIRRVPPSFEHRDRPERRC